MILKQIFQTCRIPAGCGLGVVIGVSMAASPAAAQDQARRGTRNLDVVANIAVAGATHLVAMQEADASLVFVARADRPGFALVDIADEAAPKLVGDWSSAPSPARDLTYFRLDDRAFVANADVAGLQVIDVTEAMQGGTARETIRIAIDGGLTSVFAYRHSAGPTLIIGAGGREAVLYDAEKLASGVEARIGQIDTPEQIEGQTGYDRVFAAYHRDSEQDRFYGSGGAGFHIYDFTDGANAVHLVSIDPATMRRGGIIQPTPNGAYAVGSAPYRWAPIRLYDLGPGLSGQVPLIRTAESAWTSDWKQMVNDLEVRWPYVFVAASADGLQIFNMRDVQQPYAVGFYHTSSDKPGTNAGTTDLDGRSPVGAGAIGVDVRNRDGLVIVSDASTGVWFLRLADFQGWDGRGWGMPNVSSVQHWDSGPDQ